MRRAFTLAELLVAIAILTILAAVTMSALGNLEERAKIERTRTIIKRIDGLIYEKWRSYETRPLPLRVNFQYDPGAANMATIRLRAIRDLMRMEMPERATDIDTRIGPNPTNPIKPVNLTEGLTYPADHPVVAIRNTPLPALSLYSTPAAFNRYTRIVAARPIEWADKYAQSECLYMILESMRDGETSGLDFLAPSEIGDLDGDGLKEVLDGWGEPIWFLRWAPGYTKENGANTDQSTTTPDAFDTYKVDSGSYGLRPLIVSGGPDKFIDLYLEYNNQNDKLKDIRYADSTAGNPHYPLKVFYVPASPKKQEGTPGLNGPATYVADNITNQDILSP
jgi:prepilin-type N-terminal cleavage/methylation domain-containing protein